FEKERRNDLIGVQVGGIERTGGRGQSREFLHGSPQAFRPANRSRTSASRPVTAAAATIAGDIRCVRAPGPCRPRKLRLVVEAQRSPGATMSPLIPMHIEQPLSPQVRPASVKILSSPSCSA